MAILEDLVLDVRGSCHYCVAWLVLHLLPVRVFASTLVGRVASIRVPLGNNLRYADLALVAALLLEADLQIQRHVPATWRDVVAVFLVRELRWPFLHQTRLLVVRRRGGAEVLWLLSALEIYLCLLLIVHVALLLMALIWRAADIVLLLSRVPRRNLC